MRRGSGGGILTWSMRGRIDTARSHTLRAWLICLWRISCATRTIEVTQ